MTYASRLRAKTDYRHPCNRSFPTPPPLSEAVRDRIADEEFQKRVLGGFSRKKICPGCRVALPLTGYCDSCGFAPEAMK